MNNIEISEAFTVADIRKIREANYERQKDMIDMEAIKDNKKRLLMVKELLKNKGFAV